MKDFLVLFREPDARATGHAPEFIEAHQKKWKQWMDALQQKGQLTGGGGLSPEGRVIKGNDQQVTEGAYFVGQEFVGGFLFIKATDLEEAANLVKSCPIFEAEGFAEVRELI